MHWNIVQIDLGMRNSLRAQSFLWMILVLFTTSTIASGQSSFYEQLADSAFTLTYQRVTYDPAYRILTYPNGDIPADRGVCTDVVIRAYRKLGLDLQQLVH